MLFSVFEHPPALCLILGAFTNSSVCNDLETLGGKSAYSFAVLTSTTYVYTLEVSPREAPAVLFNNPLQQVQRFFIREAERTGIVRAKIISLRRQQQIPNVWEMPYRSSVLTCNINSFGVGLVHHPWRGLIWVLSVLSP